MKTSEYNIFFKNEDKIVGYNSVSDNFILLEPLLHELFEASVNENMVDELKNVHVNLYDILINKGFIIDECDDELDKIKKISNQTDFDDTIYELTINPTMNCNFKCWYCYETHIKDSKMSSNTLHKVINFIDNVLEKNQNLKTFKLDWFGGEPLLYFNKTILPLLENIYPKMITNDIQFSSGFTSNGLLINQKVLDSCKKYGVNHFQITLDGHRDRHNKVRFISKKRGSYDQIVSNIKLCLKNKLTVTTRINISEETVADLVKIIDDFKDLSQEDKKFLIFSFHEVWQEEKNLTTDISGVVEEFRKNFLRSNYIGEQTASIKSSCYADKFNQATINYNGDVFKCTARDFEKKSREGVLEESGLINWNEKHQKRMYDTRFQNKPCLECKILPICNGGCSQHRMENEGVDYCIYNFDEHRKLDIIKEKFYSRLNSITPSDHFNETINKLLEVDFSESKQFKAPVFQETLSDFFSMEVQKKNLKPLSDIDKMYAASLKQLRKNNVETYLEKSKEIAAILNSLELNERELKVSSLFALPVIAYYYYKKGDYKESLNYTHESILNDDYFLDKHPFLYGHKIQQLHNIMRTHFKANEITKACKLCSDVLNHLIFGKSIKFSVGFWYDKYDITNNYDMKGMVYQIFCETVQTITEISNTLHEEKIYFLTAFENLDIISNHLSQDFIILSLYLKIKFSLIRSEIFDENEVEAWMNMTINSKWYSFTYPLFYNLFTSIGINNFTENKNEFKRVVPV